MQDYKLFIPLVGRILLANIFLTDGINKIPNYENVAEYMFLKGVPEFLLPFAIAFEIVGALAIIIGWRTKFFSLLFFSFCILTAVLFHTPFRSSMDEISFMKNLSVAGGFLFLFLHESGHLSFENFRKQDLYIAENKTD